MAGETLDVSVQNPANPEQVLNIKIPRSVIQENEQGIVLIQLTCNAESLLAPESGDALNEGLPDLFRDLGVMLSVNILVTADAGTTWRELENVMPKRLLISISGLNPDAASNTIWIGHPTFMDDTPSGLSMKVLDGQWGLTQTLAQQPRNAVVYGYAAQLGALFPGESIVVPISTLNSEVTPIMVGIVSPNKQASAKFYLDNDADTDSEVTLTLDDTNSAFGIVGESTIQLAPNERREIEVSFQAAKEGDYEATLHVIYQGYNVASIPLRGKVVAKSVAFLSCSPTPIANDESVFGDVFTLVAMGLILAFVSRLRKEEKVC
jgi:hypothetical protein